MNARLIGGTRVKPSGSRVDHGCGTWSVFLWISCVVAQTGCGSPAGVRPLDPAGTLDAGTPDAGTPDAGTPDAATPDAGMPPDDAPIASQTVTLTCLGDPCPEGDSVSTEALVWPASERTVNTQLGYLVSAGIYLPGVRANGTDISIDTGEATVSWGFPDEDPLHW